MENPNHKWRFLAGKIIYFHGLFSMAMLNNQMVYVNVCILWKFLRFFGLNKLSTTIALFIGILGLGHPLGGPTSISIWLWKSLWLLLGCAESSSLELDADFRRLETKARERYSVAGQPAFEATPVASQVTISYHVHIIILWKTIFIYVLYCTPYIINCNYRMYYGA